MMQNVMKILPQAMKNICSLLPVQCDKMASLNLILLSSWSTYFYRIWPHKVLNCISNLLTIDPIHPNHLNLIQ